MPLSAVNEVDKEAFYLTEMTRDVRKAIRPPAMGLAGWRGMLKRK